MRILLVDDDLGTRETFGPALRRADFIVMTAASGTSALELARSSIVDLFILDLQLPDMSGLDVARHLRQEHGTIKFVMISGHLTIELTVEAMRLGALDALLKPIWIDDLVSVVRQFSEKEAAPHAVVPETFNVAALQRVRGRHAATSAAERWAMLVLRACESPHDLKTVEQWARFVGVSYSTLGECCRLVDVRPADARDLARMLRLVVNAGPARSSQPSLLLDISDRRTLQKLLERSRFDEWRIRGRYVHDFLDRQRFVPRDNEGLAILRHLITERRRR